MNLWCRGFIILLLGSVCGLIAETRELDTDLLCPTYVGKSWKNVLLTAYYPDYSTNNEDEFFDVEKNLLQTLQDYCDDRTPYVTLAVDENLEIPYGTKVCCPELNQHFRRPINLEIRDVGSNLFGRKKSRADICVRTEADSYDKAVNRKVTLVFLE